MRNVLAPAKWTEIKNKIKTRWDKLQEEDLEPMYGDLSSLAVKIQRAYGCEKADAESQYDQFRKDLLS